MSFAAFARDPSGLSSINGNKICVVVGLGLLGCAIAQRMKQTMIPIQEVKTTSFSWAHPEELVLALETLVSINQCRYLEIVWSAGKGTFAASAEEMENEFHFYQKVIEALERLEGVDVTVSLLSSAGGLYENSGTVDDIDAITPTRHYAWTKLKQEKILVESTLGYRVFRLSSVYGPHFRPGGAGLINTLVANAKAGFTTTIYGSQNTMRDYIYSDDVAKTVVADMVENAGQDKSAEFKILASGRAVSINMLIHIISRVTGKRAKTTFVFNNKNDRDIIFTRQVLSYAVSPTSLEEGIGVLSKMILQ